MRMQPPDLFAAGRRSVRGCSERGSAERLDRLDDRFLRPQAGLDVADADQLLGTGHAEEVEDPLPLYLSSLSSEIFKDQSVHLDSSSYLL